MSHSPVLLETLRDAQRLGFFGAAPIETAVAHADQFANALADRAPWVRLVDLGSGGGLPGLVLAEQYPTADVVLLDRRQKRTDFLERAVSRLGWSHVSVWCRDADDVVASIVDGDIAPFDVVTARGFGPPEVTLRTAVACCSVGGSVVISEPPHGDRWSPELLAELDLVVVSRGGVIHFRRN
jgi:16S rRNA (guanine527-N7)-methyltransferase